MSERFRNLPEEKQLGILRAAMEVFAKYDYKKASTDLIAARAGVSKGLLFYYFQNKKELYLATFEYVKQTFITGIVDARLLEITDFFELITYASMKKLKVLEDNPHILDFSVRSFYSEKEEVSGDLKTRNTTGIDQNYEQYFRRIDYGKFKENVNPNEIFKMLVWMTDGYIHECQMHNKPFCVDAFYEVFENWTELFKKIAYKEEYL